MMGEGQHIGWLVDPCRHVLRPDFTCYRIDFPKPRDPRDKDVLTDPERAAAVEGLVLLRKGCLADPVFTSAVAKLSGANKRVTIEVVR